MSDGRVRQHWSLGTKLLLVGTPFLLLVFAATIASLWVSWQLDGGAAAVNEAGRMRMQSYRLALAVANREHSAAQTHEQAFEASLNLLRHGDPQRPLFVSWDEATHQSFNRIEADWLAFRQRWLDGPSADSTAGLSEQTAAFASDIDALVSLIEQHIAHWTAWMHLLQISMLASVILGAVALLYTGYLFVLEPVAALKLGIERIQEGDFSARVEHSSSDEFGLLADGFNGMAAHLQTIYLDLERRVQEKTVELSEKSERLELLYAVANDVARAATLEELAQGFVERLSRLTHANAVALRRSDEAQQRHFMLASAGLPEVIIQAEQCLHANTCACGRTDTPSQLAVIPILPANVQNSPLLQTETHCHRAGFVTVVSVPVQLQQRRMGELDLFYHAQIEMPQAERSLIEALCRQLAAAMDNLRLRALEREAAVSHERGLLAQELHDSIAQSLAFLKIQVQMLHDAMHDSAEPAQRLILDEIETGVRESYSDVRELLLHFRTRTSAEDIAQALRITLTKFEHQTGIPFELELQGHGQPLAPDVQIQVLHVIQEALSNVRKHANAQRVWIKVQQQPHWRFEVHDDGQGFDSAHTAGDEIHVGQRIMAERAQRIGASLNIDSQPGQGTCVVLSLESAPLTQPSESAGSAQAPVESSLREL